MDHTTYKQTRDDTDLWKQIAALLFSAQQIHGNAADITRGRNEPWSLQFFYAKPKLFGIKHNYVRYGVLGAVRLLTSAFVRTSTLLARAVANAMLAKTLPASQLERNIDYLPEARILIFKTLVFFFQKVTIQRHGLACIALWYPHTQLSKLGTIFASNVLWGHNSTC